MYVSEALANRVLETDASDVPPKVGSLVKRLLFDYIGVARRGASTETGRIARADAIRFAASGTCTVIGSPETAGAEGAAFANAVSSHSIEMDDCDDEGYYHIAPVVVSAALAAAEEAGADGSTVLAAVALGAEVMERLSRGGNPGFRDRGFHTTAVCGIFGAVAAVGKVYGLTERQLVNALGLAGAFASGTMEFYGPSMQKRVNPAVAAQNAIRATRLAREGFTGAASIFEGKRGIFNAFTGRSDIAEVTRDLGSSFPVNIGFKIYACARPIHTAVDAALSLRGSLREDPGSIDWVVLRRHPRWADFHLSADPSSYHEAQMSVKWSVALALVVGKASVDDYLEHQENAEVRALAQRIRVEADPTMQSTLGTVVEAVQRNGEKHKAAQMYPPGSGQNPASDDTLRSKFCQLTGESTAEAAVFFERINDLDSVPNAGEVLFPRQTDILSQAKVGEA